MGFEAGFGVVGAGAGSGRSSGRSSSKTLLGESLASVSLGAVCSPSAGLPGGVLPEACLLGLGFGSSGSRENQSSSLLGVVLMGDRSITARCWVRVGNYRNVLEVGSRVGPTLRGSFRP